MRRVSLFSFPVFSVASALIVGTLAAVFTVSATAQITPSAPAFLNSDWETDTRTDERPQIETDRQGNWVVVWDGYGASVSGPDLDIFVSRSSDDGQTWSAPVLLNSNGTSDAGDDLRPALSTDQGGNWVAVWYSNENLGGTAGTDYDIFFARSTDEGETWSAPALLNTNATEDSGADEIPRITNDGAGNWVAVWDSSESLDGVSGFDFEVFVARSSDDGQTWSPPAVLNSNATVDAANDARVEIVTDGLGNWVVIWASNAALGAPPADDYDIFVSRSTDNGATWSPVARLDSNDVNDTGEDTRPALATDGLGNWVAAWHSDDNLGGLTGTDRDIFVSRSTNNGATWTTGALLNTSGTSDTGHDEFVRLMSDGTGNWIAVWDSNENFTGASGNDYDVVFARSTDGGVSWSAPDFLNTNAYTDELTDLVAQVATDRNGNWIGVWETNDPLDGSSSATEWEIAYTRFTLAPGLAATSITPATLGPTNDASVNFEVTFSHDTQNFNDAADVVIVHSGTANTGVTITGGPRTYAVEMGGLSGEGTFTLAASTESDIENLGGDPLLFSVTSAAVAVERVAPTITLSSAAGDPVNGAITVTAQLSEASTDFTDEDVTATNATVSGFTGSGTSYSFTLAPSAEGLFSASVAAGTFTDAIGNGNVVSNTLTRTADLTGPVVTLSTTAGAFVNGAIGISVSLNEAGTNFTAGDVSTTNATVEDFAGSGTAYTFTLNPVAEGTFSAVVSAGALSDALGNGNSESNTLVRAADFTAPTAVLTSAAGDPVNGAITIDVALSEPSGNFTTGDVTATNATVSGFSGSGDSYSFTLTPDDDGAFGASVDAGAFTDAAGNGNIASNTVSRTADLTGPTVTLNSAAAASVNGAIVVSVTLSEDSTDFAAGDLDATNATVSGFSGSGSSYSFTLTPDTEGSFGASVDAGQMTDALGNANSASNAFTRTADFTAPTVTLSSAAGDPVSGAITVDVTLSEASVNFAAGDVTAVNATVSGFSGSGALYSFTLTPDAEGLFSAAVEAGTFTDTASNTNTASNTLSRTTDFTAPTVSMASAASDPTNISPIAVTVTFSEPVTGFTAGDVTPGNANVTNFAGTGADYTFDLAPTGQGSVTADIAAGVATDAAGNGNITATQFSRVYDSVGPSVTMTSAAPSSTNTSPIAVTVTFDEPATGFTAGDITPGNATVDNFAGSGANYSFDLIPSGEGTVTADIAAAAAVDATGNASQAAAQFSRIYDTVSPDVVLASAATDPTNTSPIAVTVTFSESVTGFTAGDITPGNATVDNFAGSGANYSFDLVPSGEGLVTADIAGSVALDAAGNANNAAAQFSRTFDSVLPSVSMTSAAADPTNTSPIAVTVTFSEPVTGFVAGDITAGNATVNNFTGSGSNYGFDLVPSGEGAVTADIEPAVAVDAAGNANTAAAQFSRVYDTVAPTATLTSASGDPVSGSISVSVTLSETSVNFVAGDVTVVNATLSGFSGSGASYSFTLTPDAEGAFSAAVDVGTFSDAAGNPSTASNTLSRTADFTAPTVSMASAASDPTNVSPIAVTVTFSEPVTGFAAGDVAGGNATVVNFAGTGADYSFDLVPTGQGAVTANIAADVATDAAGNGNDAATQFSRVYDSIAPTVSMSSAAPDPTNTSPIAVAVTFSEPVTGFAVGDITPGNAMVSNFAGTGANYSFDLTPSGEGSVTADIAGDVAIDAVANGNTAAAQFSRVYDTVSPIVSMTSAAGDPTNDSPIAASVTFSEPVTGFAAGDITAGNATVSNFSGSGANYAFDLTPSGQGGVSADIAASAAADAAGNTSAAAAQFSRIFDSVSPSVSISSGAADPTNTSPIAITVTFTEAVTGFVAGDITPGNATVSNFTGTGTSYSFDLVPSGEGTVTADIGPAVAVDAAGNANTAAAQFSRVYDTVAPAATLSSASGDPVTGAITVGVTLSEISVNFAAGDVTVVNATLSGFGGTGTSYSFTLTPDAEGAFSAAVDAGTFTDAAGNMNTASNTLSRTADFTAPTVSMTSAASDPTNASPIAVTVTFSESVTGFTAGDITPNNATVTNFAGAGANYTFDLVPAGQGTVTADIPADVAVDTAGNGNDATAQFSRVYDSLAPTVSMSSVAPNPTNTNPIAVTVTFSEPVTGFVVGDVTAGNATVTNFAGTGASYSFDLTPSGEGAVTADIAASAALDASGNASDAATQFSRVYDTVSPDVVLASVAPDPAGTSPIAVTVTFSESVSGFTAGDITPGNATVDNFAGAGASYSFDLVPAGEGLVTADVAGSVALDAAGNANNAAAQFARTFDPAAPTVNMSSLAPDPTNTSPIAVTVTFSEPVIGFQESDIAAVNANVANFAGTGASYSFELLPLGEGAVTADIPSAAAVDAAGNASEAAAQFSRTFDSVAPTVAMSSLASDPTNDSPIAVGVTFSEPVTGFVAGDITVGNASVSNFSGSGANYSFDLTPSGDGSVTADIAGGLANDAAGNGNSAAAQFSRLYDTVAPTVLMTSAEPDPTSQSPISVSVTFSEPVTGFATGDINAGNATVSNLTGSGASYSFDLTPSGDGTVTADIVDAAATDAAGNASAASAQFSRTFDSVLPSVSMTSSAPNPTNASPITMTVTFSEAVTGFTSGDITTGNATVSNFAGTGANYSFDLTPTGDGPVTADIEPAVAVDAAGNANTASAQFARTFDTTAPAVTLSSGAGDPVGGAIVVGVALTEASTDFTEGDIDVTNATVSNFSGSGASYTFTLTPDGDGEFSTSVDAGAFTDAAGNANTASNTLTRTADLDAPTATLSSASGDSVNAAISVTVTLSEASADFAAGDVSITNATLSDFAGSGTSYSFTLTPDAEGEFTAAVNAGTFTDGASNANVASNTLTRTADFTAPTVEMTSTAVDPTNVTPIAVVVTFSEPVTGFAGGDVAVMNATISNFAGTGANYTFDLMPVGDGAVTVDIAAAVATDGAGNANTAAAQFSRTFDATAPTITLTSAAGDPVNAAISVAATLSSASTDFAAGDLSATNATVSGFSGSGTSYSFTLTPVTDGTMSVSVAGGAFTDSAGNGNTASNTLSRTADLTRPSVSLSSAASNPTSTSPIPVTVTFSEAVTGFTSGDITAGNATISGFAGSGASYSFNLVPTGGGLVTANVGADVALDAAGNTNTAATQFSRTFNQAPVITEIVDVIVQDGAAYSVTATLGQGTGPVTWALVSPASPPTNMAINSSTGQLTWTANYPFSPVDVTISATGPGGGDTETWRITVLPPPIWVDFAYTGVEIGSNAQPFNTLGEAISAASAGDVIRIKGNTAINFTLEKGTISKPLYIDAANGTVRVGGSFTSGGGGGVAPSAAETATVQGTTGFVSRRR